MIYLAAMRSIVCLTSSFPISEFLPDSNLNSDGAPVFEGGLDVDGDEWEPSSGERLWSTVALQAFAAIQSH